MLIFRDVSNTQSDQNILKTHQTAPHFQTFSRELAYAPELPSICVQL